ncbi:MAG: radical SAM protein [Desulfobulbaceae bacterium]|jgi:organic radical activating enzyme|nr:radical SAM protein [Desulfobulbaceae bacterium]
MAVAEKNWKFADILAIPEIGARFAKVRRWFFLRESTYDMTSRCNIRCEGCYYYQGNKQYAPENGDPAAWRALMVAEKERGVTFVVLAGAEPALVAELCRECYQVIPLGAIASNGLKKIPKDIDYRLHISVWGNDAASEKIRGAADMLKRQIENYHGDDRAVFVYTFTPQNISQAAEVAETLAAHDLPMTFNMFSAPTGYAGPLRHDAQSLRQTAEMMENLLATWPKIVLFSHYNIAAHTNNLGLHRLYGCSYPRQNPSTAVGLGRTFRQYRADLNWDRAAACCVPDTDCDDCRHYAAGSAVVTARMYRHAVNPQAFSAWLDYVDTYLAVWVKDYEKSANLLNRAPLPTPIQPTPDIERPVTSPGKR